MAAKRTNDEIDALLAEARPWLYRLALAIVAQPDAAEDVVQDALIRASRARRQLAVVDQPSAWLRRILVRRAITSLSKPRQAPAGEPTAVGDAVLAISVRQTLDRLSALDRTLLALVHFEELSYAEIAELLNVPVGTVGSRLHAARAAFKEAWR